MIYVLFGPPGVGKTYLGGIFAKEIKSPFFDADDLINEEERELIQSGKYNQRIRNVFVGRLLNTVDKLTLSCNDLIVAEAFTKEKNREEFKKRFNGNVVFIKVKVGRELARKRALRRHKSTEHTINLQAFDKFWDEFDDPMIDHVEINNVNRTDEDMIRDFSKIMS